MKTFKQHDRLTTGEHLLIAMSITGLLPASSLTAAFGLSNKLTLQKPEAGKPSAS